MHAHSGRIAPSPASAPAVESDGPRVAIPRPEVQLVARFGATARGGVDIHALGVRETAHRKVVRTGQRAVTARLRLGAQHVVLGIPAAAIAGRIVALEELWGDGETRRLLEHWLAHATWCRRQQSSTARSPNACGSPRRGGPARDWPSTPLIG